jgi:hypothetical protein
MPPHPKRRCRCVSVRKYADMIDGVNLAHTIVGDRLWLTPRDATILIAEGWAEPAEGERRGQTTLQRALAADTPACLPPEAQALSCIRPSRSAAAGAESAGCKCACRWPRTPR